MVSKLLPSPNLRVLVVDDDRDFTDSLALLVKQWGYDVRVAHDGAQALRLVSDWQPAVAFLDMAMPRMDGLKLAQRIRSRHDSADLVLVAVTGNGSDAVRRRTEQLNFAFYLMKPTDPVLIRQILESHARSLAKEAPPVMPGAERILGPGRFTGEPQTSLNALARRADIRLKTHYTAAKSRDCAVRARNDARTLRTIAAVTRARTARCQRLLTHAALQQVAAHCRMRYVRLLLSRICVLRQRSRRLIQTDRASHSAGRFA